MSRRTIVTGAATGIGRACAIKIAEPGTQLALLGRRLEPLEEVAQEARNKGAHAVAMSCDVRDADAVRATVAKVTDEFSGIDVLVHAAGIAGGSPTVEQDEAKWHDIIQTNLTGAFYVSKEVLRQSGMEERQWGRIIFISSTGGKQGVPNGAAYSASKGGLIAFTKALGKEVATSQVTVNAVCPGFVDETQMSTHVRNALAEIQGVTPDDIRKQIEARIPTGRYVKPNEVAALVRFLISEEAGSVTLQGWNICGGLGIY